ncbi:MAG: hypothetical protein ACREIA_24510 [Opitutaceae bacterium]
MKTASTLSIPSRQQRNCRAARDYALDRSVPRHGRAKTTRVALGLELAMRHARRGVPMPQGVIAIFCGCTETAIYCARAAQARRPPALPPPDGGRVKSKEQRVKTGPRVSTFRILHPLGAGSGPEPVERPSLFLPPMHPTDKIDQPTEEALQEIAEDLEQIAEEIRGRGMRGHRVGDVAGAGQSLRALARRLERHAGTEPNRLPYYPIRG